ncbi:MAG: signal peptidase I [Paludibacteraceae bacterium]|nr:signal peptidase I [Paludibacteraceae bacterium]
MKTFNERIHEVKTKGWISAGFWGVLYVVFIAWVAWDDPRSWGWMVLLPVVVDAFTTKYINWSWWRKFRPLTKEEKDQGLTNPHENETLYKICSWVDAIVFALVAVYFINVFIFQNYQIPSSSLEKSLKVGDFLFVSKMGYGARVPNTPLSMPLMQHTWPKILGGGKSYFNHPQWDYKRLRGWDKPTKGDIVVFNFPTGDTVCLKVQNPDYYTLKYYYGEDVVRSREDVFGEIVVRPVDRRENYVKRCVGEPGDSLKIVNNVVFTRNGGDWEQEPDHEGMQFNYYVRTDGTMLTKSYLDKLGVSHDDRKNFGDGIYYFPLTEAMKNELAKNDHVTDIAIESDSLAGEVYPLGHNNWSRDNYGPIYVPAKGDKIMITADNYWIYKRIADAYEFKPMHIGEEYTFEMDYYWMQGDNRHNSADSRYWGFVPEDHIVGRPVFIWLSIEKDNPWFHGHIRWNRIGKKAAR